jgi:hypothetical protein
MKGILNSYSNNTLLSSCQVELRRAGLLPITIMSCSDLPAEIEDDLIANCER